MSTEVAIRDQFAVASPEEATAALTAALEGVSASDIRLPQVKVPGAGGTQWEIPTGDPDNPEHAKELVGVVVDHYAYDVLYLGAFDGESKGPDAFWIGGEFQHANDDALDRGIVADKPLEAQPLKDDWVGNSKLIQNRWRIFLTRAGELFPLQVDLPVMSRGGWVNFNVTNIAGRGKRTTDAIVRLGLKRDESKSGIAYSRAFPTLVEWLSDEQAAYFAAQSQALRTLTRRTYSAPTVESDSAAQKVAADIDREFNEVV